MTSLRTTMLRGVLLLIPLVLAVYFLFEVNAMAEAALQPLNNLFPDESVLGLAIVQVLAILLVLFVCYIAGLAAGVSTVANRMNRLDSSLSKTVPGYRQAKKSLSGAVEQTSFEDDWEPALVGRSDGSRFLGFEVDRRPNDIAVVFQPLSPYTQFGFFWMVPSDQVQHLPIAPRELSLALAEHGVGVPQID